MSIRNRENAQTQRIHPALDFTTEHAYVGYKNQDRTRRMLVLLRDDGRTTLFTFPNGLQQDNIELVHLDLSTDPRWSLGAVETFRRGQTVIMEKAQLFEEIKETLHKYIDLPEERFYAFLTLWNIGTYFFPLFNTYPYVYVGGIKNSGKSKLLAICSCIGFNSIISANMSVATIYRLIQNARCSMLIDEAEQLSNRYASEDFRNILLSGYKKGLKVYRNRRTPDGNFEAEAFEVYGPKMLANIEGLEEVIESRCITIVMHRSPNRTITDREVDLTDPIWQQLRDKIYPFMMKNWKAIKQTYAELVNDTTISNRDWELWKPMLALAKFFDSTTLFEAIKAFAVEKTEEAQNDEMDNNDYILVQSLLSMVTEDDHYSLRDIRDTMVLLLGNGNWLTERSVGRMLRRLGFNRRRRIGTGYQYFLLVQQVRNLAQTLGIRTDDPTGEVSELGELCELATGQGNTNNNTGEQET
jgi:hypothetical protein